MHDRRFGLHRRQSDRRRRRRSCSTRGCGRLSHDARRSAELSAPPRRWTGLGPLWRRTPLSFRIGLIILVVHLLIASVGSVLGALRLCADGGGPTALGHELGPSLRRRPARPRHLQPRRRWRPHRHPAVAVRHRARACARRDPRAPVRLCRRLDRRDRAAPPRSAHQHSVPGAGADRHRGGRARDSPAIRC